jgi:hypothetical protein
MTGVVVVCSDDWDPASTFSQISLSKASLEHHQCPAFPWGDSVLWTLIYVLLRLGVEKEPGLTSHLPPSFSVLCRGLSS